MWKSGLKVGRDDEVSINHTITTGGIKILEASSNPEGKGNPPKVDKVQESIIYLYIYNCIKANLKI